VQAQAPSILFAGVILLVVGLVVEAMRMAHLPKVPVLFGAAVAALAVTYTANRLWPKHLLGHHGVWASRVTTRMLQRILGSLGQRWAADSASQR